MRLVVISGLSGAGKGVALHALEDLGYHCVDNLPLSLLPDLARALGAEDIPRLDHLALVVDARNLTHDFARFPSVIAETGAQGLDAEVVYLGAQVEVLIKRFSETRRRHPLTGSGASLEEAIAREAELLEPIRRAADLYVDTTRTNLHELREIISQRIGARQPARLSLLIESFGFKHGVPSDADIVFDARFLPNPYWHAELRTLDGRDEAVARFLEGEPKVGEMHASIASFLERWLPEYTADNRVYLTVAIGCTGGRHRSVYLVERLGTHFRASHENVMVRHREL